jgi:hypothetical protein
MRLIKLTTIAVAIGACGGFATAADAGTITYSSYGFSGENVHITDTLLGVYNEYGGAGLITLNGASVISGYCVDISDWLLNAGTYHTGVNPSFDPNLSGVSSITGHSKIADIGALMLDGSNAAAVQLAIWETEYGAAVTITPDDAGLQTVAAAYLTNLQSQWTLPADRVVRELTPANGQTNQDLVYLAPVPEPASVGLLGSAMLALGYIRKRRQSPHG